MAKHPRWYDLNGSFESVSSEQSTTPIHWRWRSLNNTGAAEIAYERTDDHASSGEHSVSIEIGDADPKKSYGHWEANVSGLSPETV